MGSGLCQSSSLTLSFALGREEAARHTGFGDRVDDAEKSAAASLPFQFACPLSRAAGSSRKTGDVKIPQ